MGRSGHIYYILYALLVIVLHRVAFEAAKIICGREIVATLSRDNTTANAMKRQTNMNLINH
jgi:hypothetical protein